MNRDEWEFEFSAGKIAQAAKAKKSLHEERLKAWMAAKEKVMVELLDSDIGVDEGVEVDGYSGGNVRRASPRVVVREDLVIKLAQCADKIREHQSKVCDYENWFQVLSANSESRLQLHSDDYLYFFGN